MERRERNTINAQKKSNPIDREFNTAVFLLRCTQIGLSASDLQYLDIGMVKDMLTEAGNDNYDYPRLATKEDMARFRGF